METEEIWLAEVLKRLKDHPFAKGEGPAGLPPAVALLKAIYCLHFNNPQYRYIEPSLPVLAPQRMGFNTWAEPYLIPSQPFELPGSLPAGHRQCNPIAYYSIRDILRSRDSAILHGDPGSGKTTLLKWAAHYLVHNPQIETPIPLFLPFDQFTIWKTKNSQKSIYHFFWEAMLGLPREFGDQFHTFMEDVHAGPTTPHRLFRILLDGPNEFTETTRLDFSATLDRLNSSFSTVLASRPWSRSSQLPPWHHYHVAPLPPEGIATFISQWLVGLYPQRMAALYQHLDKYTDLRQVAANPSFLSVLCTIAAAAPRRFVANRAQILQSLLAFITDRCNHKFAIGGSSFTSAVRILSEDIAYRLMLKSGGSPYEFLDSEITSLAHDQGQLAETWRRAGLIKLVDPDKGSYSFLHPVLQEYLAAQAIIRYLRDGTLSIDAIGLQPRWFSVMTFVFGHTGCQTPPSPLCDWLATVCRAPDRFGLILTRVAHFLSEVRQCCHGACVLGTDIRAALWDGFTRSPDPSVYVRALVAIDPDYAIEQALRLRAIPPHLIARLKLLIEMIPLTRRRFKLLDAFSRRSEIDSPVGSSAAAPSPHYYWRDMSVFPDNCEMPFKFEYVHSRSTTSSILATVAKSKGKGNVRLLKDLAKQHTREAEQYLVERFHGGATRDERFALLDALGLLGTRPARDVVIESFDWCRHDAEMLTAALRSLESAPIEDNGPRIFPFLGKQWPPEVRYSAVRILTGCGDQRVLDQLAAFAHLSEPDQKMRIAVFRALGQTGYLGILPMIEQEGLARRQYPDEQKAIWDYLKQVVEAATNLPHSEHWLDIVESILFNHLDQGGPLSREMIAIAGALSGSQKTRTMLNQWTCDESLEPEIRAAAIAGLSLTRTDPLVKRLRGLLEQGVAQEPAGPIARACAEKLAFASPDELLQLDYPVVEIALWKMSLKTGKLVFPDRVVDPARAYREAGVWREFEVVELQDATHESGIKEEVTADNRPRKTQKRQPKAQRVQRDVSTDISKLMKWSRDTARSHNSPAFPLNEEFLTGVWWTSSGCTLAEARAYRIAAVFCQLVGKEFRISKSDWDRECNLLPTEAEPQSARRSLDRIFELGIAYVKHWPKLAEILEADELPDEPASVRMAYGRAIERIDKPRAPRRGEL